MSNGWLLLLFALLAAGGNAMFAAGQRLTTGIDNSFSGVAMSVVVCLVLVTIAVIVSGGYRGMTAAFTANWRWALLSGTGLFLTYLGFSLLYGTFGAGAYVYYAVLSIITTSFVVGMIILREQVNVHHILSGLTSIGAIILYSIGNGAR